MRTYLNDFVKLFFPKTCLICGKSLYKHESQICLLCIKDLPRSYFHLADNNPLNKIFWGRVDVKDVISFLLYKKENVVKDILHALKYRNCKEVGYELGKLYCRELANVNYLQHIDFLIPVPLHPKKLAKRGYNQSEWIANGMCESLNAKVLTDVLFKATYTKSQTNKGRYQRWINIEDSFDIRNTSILENKNVLLIDDVLTTGATIEACVGKLKKIKGISVFVATLAYASN